MAKESLTQSQETTTSIQTQEQCVHHWIIDPPEGPVSKGACKLCGEEKEFPNDLSYSWKEDNKDEIKEEDLFSL